ncbi:MAG: hypothetical protein Q4P05_07075 [Actinomycetaceae bacterium]|nr:hypothetical protein [Actinomycetaceae bacterium]
MSFAGWIIVALAVLIAVYLTPALIKKRQHIVETPIEDRFSTDLTLIGESNGCFAVRGEPTRQQPPILRQSQAQASEPQPDLSAHARVIDMPAVAQGGRKMRESRENTTNIARRGVPSTSRQLAKLRAARAARIARENAAGQRRFVLAGLALTLFVAFGVAAWFSTFSPWWMILPAVGLVAVIASGRVAYQKSVAASEHENLMLRELREKRRRDIPAYRSERPAALSTEVATRAPSESDIAQLTDLPDEQVECEEMATEISEEVGIPTEVGISDQEAVRAMLDIQRPSLDGVLEESDEADAWIPRELPEPLYTRVESERRVFADTFDDESSDAEQIEVEVSTPVRPVAASPAPADALTSEEAAAQAPVAFNLDEILEHRRAQ